MNANNRLYIRPVDVHAALARAHADRGEYISSAIAKVPSLLKRLGGKLRPSRQRLPQSGAWA
jgi:hypothetical protein